MGGNVEKPMLQVAGKSMLRLVVETLRQIQTIDRIVVAGGSNTPDTTIEARTLGVEIFPTPGNGFEEDMRNTIRSLGLEDVLVISADLPLITPDIISEAITRYHKSGKPALAVMAKIESYQHLGTKPQHIFEIDGQRLAAVGLNIIDGRRISDKELDQEVFVVDSPEAILNVNNLQELELARKTLDAIKKGVSE